MALPDYATRDDILVELSRTPQDDLSARRELMRRFAMAPSRPGIKVRHGGRPGEIEILKNGCWAVTDA